MALEPVTYTEEYTNFTVPASVAATLDGYGDTVTLSEGDTLVSGSNAYGDTISSAVSGLTIEVGTGSSLTITAPLAMVTVDNQGNATIEDGGNVIIAPASSTLPPPRVTVGNVDASVLSTITGTAPVGVTVDAGGAANIDDAAATISIFNSGHLDAVQGLAGSASYAVRADPEGISGLVDTITGVSQANLQGAFVGEVADFSDGTSELLLPGSGAYGIYANDKYFSLADANGGEVSSVLDIYNGKTETSIWQIYQSLNDGSGVVGGYAFFSGPDRTGTETANFNYENGTSAHVAPFPSGAFGCFETVDYYAGINETGQDFQTSDDFVNGTSQSSLTTNGFFGCYKANVHTDGLDATGNVTQVTLDFFGGVSRTITPISVGGQETDVYTSGPDGTGRVLSSTIDPAGTAVAALNAVTGDDFSAAASATAAATAKAAFAQASVTHADFAATKGSAASLVSPADLPSRLSMPVAAPFAGMADTASPAIVPAILQHTR